MKTKRDKTIKNVLIFFLLFSGVVLALFLYAHNLKKQLNENINTTLKEISEQSVITIENEVKSEFYLIEEIASRLSYEQPFNIDESMEYLKHICKRYTFKQMGIRYKDGTTYTTDDIMLDLSYSVIFDPVFQGETIVSDCKYDKIDNEQIIIYATSIKENGEVIASLFATFTIENFRDLMSVNTFNNSGYSYIVKQNGDTVIDSVHPISFVNMTNILKSISEADKNNVECCAELQKNMNARKSGDIIFTNKIDKYLYYTPLGVNDWYLMNVVPKSVAEKSVSVVMLMTYALCTVVALISVLFMLYLINLEKKKRESVHKILYIDPLTEGKSYTKFSIDTTLSLKQHKEKAAYLVMDLDNFNLISEVYGHEAGNNIIKYIHETIKQFAPETMEFARRVADNFVALIYYDTKEKLLEDLTEFCNVIQENQPWYKNEYIIKPKIGVYFIDDHNENLQRIENLASIARTSINDNHEQLVAFYEDFYKDQLLYNKQLEDQMEIAFKNDEFVPFFQPKYDTQSQQIIGAEALARWIKPDQTIISPGVFIPLAESNGFVVKLDSMMFRKVCERQRELLDKGYKPVPISVNLSRQVLYNRQFINEYTDIVKKYNIPPDLVQLEITESTMFENQDEFKYIIDELHEHGFKILMDDFGVGYSSLQMLKSIPIDVMKLDKSFVNDYNDTKSRKILVGVINLAKTLDIAVIAEGVETKDQYEFLKEMCCNAIQGFYFAKPMPFNEFLKKLE